MFGLDVAKLDDCLAAGVVGDTPVSIDHADLPNIFVLIGSEQCRQRLIGSLSCPHELQAQRAVARFDIRTV